jgi:hypothetical protein
MTDYIFDNKTLPDIFSDIYKNTDSKREQINTFITKLVLLIRTPEDATIISPIIKDFMDVAVKNDEHIIRVAQIVQRLESVSKKGSSMGDLLTEDEKQQLLTNLHVELEDIKKDAEELDENIFSLREKL